MEGGTAAWNGGVEQKAVSDKEVVGDGTVVRNEVMSIGHSNVIGARRTEQQHLIGGGVKHVGQQQWWWEWSEECAAA